MSEFLYRLRGWSSRIDLRDQNTHQTIAAVTATIVILAALVALPVKNDAAPDAADRTSSGSAVEGQGDVSPGGALAGTAPGRRSSSTVPGGGVTGTSEGSPAAPPVTESEVKVGITYTEDPGGANAAAGFSVGQVDQRRGWEALIADINTDPPFGRRVVPVWYSQTENDVQSKGAERIAQEACERFTKDNKVFVVWVGTIGNGDTLPACLTKAKVPNITFGTGESYSKTFKDFPYLVEPTKAAMDRMAAFYVETLFDAGFFSKFKNNSPPFTPTKPADGKPQIGLIRYDQQSHKAGAAALKKQLSTHGLALCGGCEFEISYSGDNVQVQLDDAAEINAAIQNCKSRPNGPCTHMLFLGSTAERIPVFFMDGAERQQYRPRIGFSPLDSWTFARGFLGGQTTDPQFRESQLVTWDPTELGAKPDAFNRCRKVFEDAGEEFSPEDEADKESMIPVYCDSAWYHAAAMKAAGPTLNLDAWMNGVHTMEATPSAGSYLMQTKEGRHDGIGAIRIGEWFDSCKCFKPVTKVITV